MLRVNPIQTDFSSGELSPWLLGRVNTEKYLAGAARLENFLVRPQGGVEYRTGTRNAAAAASSTLADNVALIPFVFSRTDAICIEVSAAKFRFLRSGALLMNGGSPVEVTVIYGTGNAVPYANADIPDIHFTQSADVVYLTHPSHPPATLSRYSDTDWRYEQISFDYGPFQDQEPGEQDYSLNISAPVDRMTLTSATAGDFPGGTYTVNSFVEYAYSGQKFLGKVKTNVSTESIIIEPLEDYCFSMAPEVYSPGVYTGWDSTNNVPTFSQTFSGTGISVAFSNTGVVLREMVNGYLRFSDKAGNYYWMLVTGVGDIPQQVAYGIIATGNILAVNRPSGIITRSARSVKTVLRASAANFFNTTRDLGRKYRLVLNGTVLYATTRAHDAGLGEPANGTTNMAVTLDRAPPLALDGFSIVDNGTTNEWNRGAWYVGNYPRTVSFHEERLGFFGTTDEPQNGWLSKTADFYNFAPTDNQLRVLDNSAITFTVASNTVNEILWAASHDGELIVGSAGGEYVVRPSSSGKPLTATNLSVKSLSSFGCDYSQPLLVGRSLLAIQRGGRKIRQVGYATYMDRRVSLDLNVYAEHIFRQYGTAEQIVHQLLPDSVVYVRTSSGYVAVLAYEEDQQMFAWSRLVLGGSGFVESIASVPHGSEYYLYMVVRRTINGSTVRTIEYLRPEFTPSSATDWSTGVFLDNWSTGTLSGAVTTITGLTNFAAATVWAQVGNVFFTGTVNGSGVLTIPAEALTLINGTDGKTWRVGFQYEGWFRSMPVEAPAMAGTGQGKPKRIHRLVLRLVNSVNFSHGLDPASLRAENFRKTTDPTDAPPPMRTEDYPVSFDNGIDTGAQFYIKQGEPYPLAFLSIMPEMAQNQ